MSARIASRLAAPVRDRGPRSHPDENGVHYRAPARDQPRTASISNRQNSPWTRCPCLLPRAPLAHDGAHCFRDTGTTDGKETAVAAALVRCHARLRGHGRLAPDHLGPETSATCTSPPPIPDHAPR